jgi:hypothetical protein
MKVAIGLGFALACTALGTHSAAAGVVKTTDSSEVHGTAVQTGQSTFNFFPATKDIDFNIDGIPELRLNNYAQLNVGVYQNNVAELIPLNNSKFLRTTGPFGGPSPIVSNLGDSIGPASPPLEWTFNTTLTLQNASGQLYYSSIDWLPGVTKYMGMQFQISGQTHYGWVGLSYTSGKGSIFVHDYAYQTTPNTALPAGQIPEPGALGLLLLAAPTLLTRRK